MVEATQKALEHAFVFYSYRDPRIEGTFSDFDAAVEWACSGAITDSMLKEAQLGMLAQIDKPLSPASKAKKAFTLSLKSGQKHYKKKSGIKFLSLRLNK